MKIDKVFINNIKGVTKEYELSGSNIICGDNGSGKTAILDAIRLACLGYHPKFGKSGNKIFSLSSANEMAAKIRFSSGETNEYSSRHNGTSISKKWDGYELSIESKMQLDPSLFFDSTANDKRQKIFALLSEEERKEINKKIYLAVKYIPNEGTALETEIIESLCNKVKEILESEENASHALKKIQEFCKSCISDARKNLDRVKKTIESHATNTNFNSAFLQTSEFYLNSLDELSAKKEKLSSEINKYESIANDIHGMQMQVYDINEKLNKKGSDNKVKKLKSELSELEKAYYKEIKVLSDEKDKLELYLEKSSDINKNAKDKSFDSYIKKLPNGTYIVKVECLVEDGEISTSIWEANPFDMVEKVDKISKLTVDINSLNIAFESECEILNKNIELEELKLKLDVDESRLEDLSKAIRDKRNLLNTFREKELVNKEIDGIDSEKNRIKEQLKQIQENEFQQKNGEKLQSDKLEFSKELEILKICQAKINEEAELISTNTLGKILDPMNMFAERIDLPQYSIINGELGYLNKGRHVEYSSFSGSEMSVFKTAATVALAMSGELKIAIIDELGRFDDSRKRKTLKTLIDFVNNGTIDQFLCVDVISPISISDLNIIQVYETR